MVVTRTLQNPQLLSFCLLTSTKNSDGKSYYVYQKSLEFVNIKGPAQTPLMSRTQLTPCLAFQPVKSHQRWKAMLIAFGSAEALCTAGISAVKKALADPNTESGVRYGPGFPGRNQPKLRIQGTLKLTIWQFEGGPRVRFLYNPEGQNCIHLLKPYRLPRNNVPRRKEIC